MRMHCVRSTIRRPAGTCMAMVQWVNMRVHGRTPLNSKARHSQANGDDGKWSSLLAPCTFMHLFNVPHVPSKRFTTAE